MDNIVSYRIGTELTGETCVWRSNINRGGEELAGGALTELAADIFTHGQCHSFAVALAELTGGEIVGLGYSWDGGAEFDGWDAAREEVGHFAVRIDGELWDIRGPLDEERVAMFGGEQAAPWTRDDIERELVETAYYFPWNPEAALPFAVAVIEGWPQLARFRPTEAVG